MRRNQFVILNTIAGALALLILVNVFMGYRNQKMSRLLSQHQIEVNNAQKASQILGRLEYRIAQLAGEDITGRLAELMTKNNLRSPSTGDTKKAGQP